MPLWTTVSTIQSSSSWARGLALCNIAALIGTIVAIIYLNRFQQLSLCPDVQIGSAILSVLTILGHLSITGWLTYSAVKFNSYPPPFDQSLSTSERSLVPTQSGGITESLIASTSNSLNSSPLENELKIESNPTKSCCSGKAIAITGLITAFLPVFILYVISSAMAWIRGTTIADANASLQLSGLLHDSTVSRAEKGIVRIDALNEHDLYFTQGVAHAATRLWQMEFQRRVGAGRLAEAVGEGGIEVDKLFRTLGVYEAAERDYNNLDEDTQSTILAYCEGVNEYINKAVNSGQHYLPIEFVALGLKPEIWKPADSLVWSKIMSWDLSLNLNDEYQRYRWLVSKNITKERINILKPPFDTSRFPTVLSDADITANVQTEKRQSNTFATSLLSDGMEAALLRIFKEHSSHQDNKHTSYKSATSTHQKHQLRTSSVFSIFSSLQFLGSSFRSLTGLGTKLPCASASNSEIPRGTLRRNTKIGASNNWVVHGNRTLSGKPLLCNDPHLQLLSPSIWQLTHLSCPSCESSGLEAIGASFIGLPGIVIGRNKRIAWAVTNTGADVQDLYIMTEKDGDSSSYLFDGAYVPYNISSTVIKVKDGKDILFQVRSTRFGPVITDNGVYDSLGGPSLSLRWVSIDPTIPDTTFSSFRCLNRAANYSGFRECLSTYVAPSQNFIFADTEGDIGYQMPGWIPQRNPDHTGGFPVPGDSAQFDWKERVPYDDLPRTLNPPEGFIVSANNRVTPPSYKYNLTVDWDSGSDGYRAKRISQLIQESPLPLTPDDMVRIQTDYTSLAQRDLAQALYNVNDTLFREGGGGIVLKNLLYQFDGNLIVGSQIATLWADVLGQLSQLANREVGNWVNMVFLLNALESDAIGSTDQACLALSFTSCAAFAANALDVVADMRGISASGSLNQVPAWGIDIHKLNINHAVLSASPLACVADRIESHGGDDFTINVGGYSGNMYEQDHGPSYRQIIDLASPDASRFVHPMGVDGAPFSFDDGSDGVSSFAPSGSYDDLLPLWLEGNYVPMSMAAVIPDTSRLTMRLSPGGS